jgi:hypothetical protein
MTTVQASCKCQLPPFYFGDYDTVECGDDPRGAEVSVSTCRRCGVVWLTYLIEEPHQSRSGRWWRVEVPPESRAQVSAASAKEFIERQPSGYAGGSFFNSPGHAIIAPIHVA